ncbi:MAG: PH domain-containing protein [Ruminococcaceae bacterium]|nr:PH domain-containing protein [Oscillospiraceae bacterium]
MRENLNYVWTDRKRIIFGLPWTFTKYKLNETCLYIKSGVFNVSEEEIRLYRILDITMKRSFWERLFGLGTLHLCTADKSTPEIDILHIKKPASIRTMLSDMIEKERSERYVGIREFMGDESDEYDGDGIH